MGTAPVSRVVFPAGSRGAAEAIVGTSLDVAHLGRRTRRSCRVWRRTESPVWTVAGTLVGAPTPGRNWPAPRRAASVESVQWQVTSRDGSLAHCRNLWSAERVRQ